MNNKQIFIEVLQIAGVLQADIYRENNSSISEEKKQNQFLYIFFEILIWVNSEAKLMKDIDKRDIFFFTFRFGHLFDDHSSKSYSKLCGNLIVANLGPFWRPETKCHHQIYPKTQKVT